MRTKAILVCLFLIISAIGVRATTYKTIYSFSSWDDGENPYPGVIFDQAGNLYGVVAWGEESQGTVFQLTPSPGRWWTYNSWHQFGMQDPDGAGPIGGLAMDEAGNLYGTASSDVGPDWHCGTVFQVPRSGGFVVLHYFNNIDGCDPESTVSYSNGVIRGATRGGGSQGQGTVFSMDTSGGSFQFDSFTGKKGSQPLSAVSLWGYGTTVSGGGQGQGEIYRLDPRKGILRVHSFNQAGAMGSAPMGDLLTLDVGGVRTIYGTTFTGGAGGGGTVYRLTELRPNSDLWLTRALYSFTSGSGEGWAPAAGLTADAAGNLYGTTFSGGTQDSCGTVFKLSPGKNNKWTHTVLYSFDYYNNWEDGCQPTGGVVFDKAGNLYGTTQWGGEDGYGAVYEITP
jgi:uncharacterized repeat protein (TIGR03803 family)